MKIAFTSCMATSLFPQQPVWDQIAAARPDRLVLLGDSVYIDAPPLPLRRGVRHARMSPKEMAPADFLQHVFARYQALLALPNYRALVSRIPTDAIWDDHDFLWNECAGEGAILNPAYEDHIRISRALFNAYRRALDARLAPGSFPATWSDGAINQPAEPPPGYRWRELPHGLVLHLTDGRSHRHGHDLLGAAQRGEIEARMARSPEAVHVVASGSVVTGKAVECWAQFADQAWLMALARRYKILVLSGDIHRNRFNAVDVGAGRMLFEATSSGAAIRMVMSIGARCQNHALMTVDDAALKFDFFAFGAPDTVGTVRIDRQRWQLLPTRGSKRVASFARG